MAISLKNVDDRLKVVEARKARVEYYTVQGNTWVNAYTAKTITVPDLTQWHFIIVDDSHQTDHAQGETRSIIIPMFRFLRDKSYETVSGWEYYYGNLHIRLTWVSNTSIKIQTNDSTLPGYRNLFLMRIL